MVANLLLTLRSDRCVGGWWFASGALAAELWVRECRTGFQQFPFVSDNLTYQIPRRQ